LVTEIHGAVAGGQYSSFPEFAQVEPLALQRVESCAPEVREA